MKTTKEKKQKFHRHKRVYLRRLCSVMLVMIMCITLMPVNMAAVRAMPATTRNYACETHANWTYIADAGGHHHKYCYDCGKEFDYDECTPQYQSAGEEGHYTQCKVCGHEITMPQEHDRLSSKTVVINGAAHTMPCCSKCGYFNDVSSGDGHQYELVKKAHGCAVECKLCGALAPYSRYHTHYETFQCNRSCHWSVCEICGEESKRIPHDWVYVQSRDIHGNLKYDLSNDPVMEKGYCRECGFNLRESDTNANVKAHKHEFEKKYVGDGYHREFCKICGMPNGISKKCMNRVLTTTEKYHIYTCPDCHGVSVHTHIFTGDKGSSTDTNCAGKCTVCGYTGDYTVYDYDNNRDVWIVKKGTHVLSNETTRKNATQHMTKCLNCNYEIIEDCDFENDCFFTPNKVSKTSHYRTCKKCGNMKAGEFCTNFQYEDFTAKTHIVTCTDCLQKNVQRHNMVVNHNRTTETTHTQYCDCGDGKSCGRTVTENHKMRWAKENIIPNSILGDGGYEKVLKCKVCGWTDETTRAYVSTQSKPDPPKQKVFDHGAVKIRKAQNLCRPHSQSGSGGSSGGLAAYGMNRDLFSVAPISDGLVEHMAEHAEEYVDEDFDLEAEVEQCKEKGELPQEAEAYARTEDGESGNTYLVISPFVTLSVLEYDEEENPGVIKYDISASYKVILSMVKADGETEEVVLEEKPMEVNFPLEMTVPVPVDFTDYNRTVVVTQNHNGQEYHYLGTVDANKDYSEYTVAFTAEQGLSEFILTATNHKLTHVEATEPTRYANGNIEYWYDEVDKKFYTDIWCTHAVEQQQTVIAKYPDMTYTVTYYANGGTGTMDSFTADAGTTLILPECGFTAPEGMKFDSWSIGYAGDTYVLKEDTTVMPQWIDENAAPTDLRPCTITFDKFADDAVGEMAPQVFQRGIAAPMNPAGFTRPGYMLYGWSVTGSQTNAIPDGGMATFYRDQVMTAVWRKCSVLSYDANAEDAMGTMPDQQVINSVYTVLNKNTFTREGYEFIGWSEDSDATNVSYKDEDYKTFSSNHTFYAVWKKLVNITFDPNAEDVTGTMDVQKMQENEFTALVPSKFKREGYEFGGWVLTPNATFARYADKYALARFSEDTTLYALWNRINTYTFSANGGVGTMEEQTVITRTKTPLNKNTFTREGYDFKGWATSEASTYVSYEDEKEVTTYSDGDKTLYAVWAKDVTITFDPNGKGVTGTMEPLITQNGVYTQLPANGYTREGYEFKGWATIPEAATSSYADEYKYFKTEDDVTLYAVWHKPVTVTFDANGEDVTGTMDVQEATDRTYFTLNRNAFSKEGYYFDGWSLSAGSTMANYTNGYNYVYLTGDTTLYAVWHKNVSVTFHANGGTGSMASQTLKDRTFSHLNANTYTREGYTFAGWGLSPNATFVSAKDEGLVYLTDHITYYAIWRPDTTQAVTQTVTDMLNNVRDVNPESLTEEEKTNADEAVEKAVEAILILNEMEDSDVAGTVLASREDMEALEDASLIFGSSAVESEQGVGLIYDTENAPDEAFAKAGNVRVCNALMNAFAIGVSNEYETVFDENGEEKVAVTFSIAASDEEVNHVIGAEYDEDSMVAFSMALDNLILNYSTNELYIPVIVTLPIPKSLQGAEEITLIHYNSDGTVKEVIRTSINREDNTITFVVSSFSDFALVQDFVPGWRETDDGVRYYKENKQYIADSWKRIDGSWYYFDSDGYRRTGWYKEEDRWYYLKEDGSMLADQWKRIAGKWYHFNGSGVLQTGWYKEDDVYYYLKPNGAMAVDEWVENDKYYLDASGKWIKGKTKEDLGTGTWKKNSTGWWYQYADGSYPKNRWKKIDGEWYHFDQNGYMQTGWLKDGGYYYYLKANGTMAKEEYVDDGKYYVDADGHWVP